MRKANIESQEFHGPSKTIWDPVNKIFRTTIEITTPVLGTAVTRKQL